MFGKFPSILNGRMKEEVANAEDKQKVKESYLEMTKRWRDALDEFEQSIQNS